MTLPRPAIVGLVWLVVLGAQPTFSGTPQASASLAVMETVVRFIATRRCHEHSCYLAVDGRPASRQLLALLADLKNVLPTPAPDPQTDTFVVLINLSYPRTLPDGSRSVPSAVGRRFSHRELAAESCTYRVFLSEGRWRVNEETTLCELF